MLLLFWLFLLPYCLTYQVGTGIYDITGPVAGINMMGYAIPKQIDHGLHLRLFSRAFVVRESSTSKPIVFVSLDTGMVSQLVKSQVVMKLMKIYGDLFTHQNVMISATHTHSGPAGYFQYLLYSITSFGYVKETLEAITDGIVKSIVTAYNSLQETKILITSGELLNASINRSPASYLQNPTEERARYAHDVDKQMILLKFVAQDGTPIGMINWFAVHGVSMNNTNQLISSDNKGLASILFEKRMNPNVPVGRGPFVAAFAQSNEGDVSPNTNGPKCIDTGLPCDYVHSTCNGRVELCIASGPGKDMFESTEIIAKLQLDAALSLFEKAEEELAGPIGFVHQFIDMSNQEVVYKDLNGTTCKPAMGYSFAAGTTDGPGDFDFVQSERNGTVFWDLVRDMIKKPSPEMIRCHAPKPVLLATGEINNPYPWQPAIVETQIFRIGNLLIAAVPGEFTTMSGRRIREAVEEMAKIHQPSEKFRSVIAGLSNVYASYVTTPEEYQLQRYEGASTIYGPLTLPAYQQQFAKLSEALIKGTILPPGPDPPYFLDKLISLVPDVIYDSPPWRKSYGYVLMQPKSIYPNKSDTVEVVFVSASPRNNMRLNDTYLNVEMLDEKTQNWIVKYTDADWETRFEWKRNTLTDFILGHSEARIFWSVSNIDGQCIPGTYRIRHFGTAKNIFKHYINFEGQSASFLVQCN